MKLSDIKDALRHIERVFNTWEDERRRLRFRNKWRRVATSVARWDATDHKHYYHQVSYYD